MAAVRLARCEGGCIAVVPSLRGHRLFIPGMNFRKMLDLSLSDNDSDNTGYRVWWN
jgi:hypothetical protein